MCPTEIYHQAVATFSAHGCIKFTPMNKIFLACLFAATLAQAADTAPTKEAPATPKPFYDPAAPAPTVDPTKDVPPVVIPPPTALPPEKKKKKQ